ncbi:MAG: PDZ domain-containing protein [Rhodothermales bacterium]
MKSLVGILFLSLTLTCASFAQEVAYEIAFPNRAHHEAEVTAVFSHVPTGKPLQIRMSRTSPGRYALHEFAKNVYNVHFFDGKGNVLTAQRPNLHEWDVSAHDGTVRMAYTLYGDRADGTYDGINSRFVHLNMPATFVWARGLQDAPVTVQFDVPEPDWDIATQLYPAGRENEYHAPDFWYLMDSPTHIGRISWRAWDVKETDGHHYSMRLALDHDGTEAELDEFVARVRKVVAEEDAMWQDIPDYDPGTYTFIAVYLPWANGDGMEHRNSTSMTSSHSLAESNYGQISTVSHEFFHSWNVERMRPKSLEPFNFEAANVSRELWFAEGFTNYYTDLFIRRAGLINDAGYGHAVSSAVNAVTNAPGRNFYSPVGMSMQSPFVDAAVSIDPQNKANTFISYYTWGEALGLGLDLTLRRDFGLTLDDYMRAMWAKYGKNEVPYTLEDLKVVLGELTANPAFAKDFFERYIEGHEIVDYESLLSEAGFAVVKARPGHAWFGASFENDPDGGAIVTSEPLMNGPLYAAGVGKDDRILRMNGQSVTNADYVIAAADLLAPGDTVNIEFSQAGEMKEAAMILTEDPTIAVVPYELTGRKSTTAMKAFRSKWLSSLVKKED